MNLPVLDVSEKWSHKICGLLCLLLLLSRVFSRFIDVVACISLLFMAEQPSMMWMDPVLFPHSSADGHLGCFSFLAVTNNAAVNIHVQAFVWVLSFLGYIQDEAKVGLQFFIWKIIQ